MKTYEGIITLMPSNGIFVFGSNTQGRHGKGSALTAKQKFGAIYGQSTGIQGRSYAICTKDLTKSTHPSVLDGVIINQIFELYEYAEEHPTLDFYVVYGIQPNLNGYTPQQMADIFGHWPIPSNIVFNSEFNKLIERI